MRFSCSEVRSSAAPLKPPAATAACVSRDTPKKENDPTDGQDCQNRRPQKDYGHDEVDRLSQVQQANAHRQACKGPRTRHPWRSLYLVLRVRLLRETLGFTSTVITRPGDLPGLVVFEDGFRLCEIRVRLRLSFPAGWLQRPLQDWQRG